MCGLRMGAQFRKKKITPVMGVSVLQWVIVNVVQRKEIVKMKNRLLKKILIAVMECVFILACCFVVLVVFCMWLFSHTGV